MRTGDLIYGDDGGVVVVPWEQVEGVLELALKRIIFDDKEMQWVESGRSVYELISMLWDPTARPTRSASSTGQTRTLLTSSRPRWAAHDPGVPVCECDGVRRAAATSGENLPVP